MNNANAAGDNAPFSYIALKVLYHSKLNMLESCLLISCTDETPFDGYFGRSNQNSEHVSVWAAAKEWIIKEVEGEIQPSSPLKYEIGGPDAFCDQATYLIAFAAVGNHQVN